MPISVPPYMPIAPRQRPNIDIAGSIGGLGDALIGGLEYGAKRKADRATKAAFQEPVYNADGTMNYAAMAGKIAQGGGDIDTALTLTRLAEVQAQNAWQRGQPDWQVINGSLYNLRDLGGQGGGQQGGGQSAGPTGPAPAYPEYPEEPSSGQPDYPPDVPQPQTAQAPAEPQPVIRGQPEPPKTTTIYVNGQPQIMQFNPATGQYDIPLGGQKAPAPRPGPKPPTIDAMRSQQLLKVIEPELATLETTFADLAKPENQAGALVPGNLSNYAVTPGYQRAKQALGTIAQSYLYSLSGATAPIEEVNKLVDSMMPRIGEDATTIADKRARIRTMVDSIRTRAGGGAAAEGEVPPDEQIAGPPDEPQGEIVESGGVRYMLMPDGTVVQLD